MKRARKHVYKIYLRVVTPSNSMIAWLATVPWKVPSTAACSRAHRKLPSQWRTTTWHIL